MPCLRTTAFAAASALMCAHAHVSPHDAHSPSQSADTPRVKLDAAPTVPSGLGVMIDYTIEQPGETAMLGRGFMIARFLLDWSLVETQTRGNYNWSAYDTLLETLENNAVMPYAVLGNANPLYDGGMSPASAEAIDGFVAFSLAAVGRYAGIGVIWEIMDEPNLNASAGTCATSMRTNDASARGPSEHLRPQLMESSMGGFGGWCPSVNVSAYTAVALAVSQALEAHFPDELLVGPALAPAPNTSDLDVQFADAVFASGVLDYWDGVSAHFFQLSAAPEAVAPEVQQLTALVAHYNRRGRDLPILSGAWGYSTAVPQNNQDTRVNETTQAKYVVRMLLFNRGQGVNVTIWQNWRDGPDSNATLDNYGVVYNPYNNATLPFLPKPAFLAVAALTNVTSSCTFLQMTSMNGTASDGSLATCYVDVFTCTNAQSPSMFATWCAVPDGVTVPLNVPIATGGLRVLHAADGVHSAGLCFIMTTYTGAGLPQSCTQGTTISINATNGPTYAQGPILQLNPSV